MKILIHGLNFSPELIGIGKYTGELAAWLVQAGHDVHVVTAPPYYPQWKVQRPYSGWKYQKENWQGVQVIRCPLWVPRNQTGLSRVIHLFSFAVSSFFVMLNQIKFKPDVVISVVPTLFSASTAACVARICNSISWLHIQDFELDAAVNLGMVHSNNVLMQLALHWEKSILNQFDRVSSISNQMVNRLITKGVPEEKTVLFPNWVDTKIIYPLPTEDNPYRSKMGISNDQIVILYSGNMGSKQGLGLIVDVARKLQENHQLVFVLCGNGSSRSELEKSASDLQNLKFLDIQPIEVLNRLLNSADIHILPQQAEAADLVMPSKLMGMMASGKPIIATANPGTDLADVVNQVGIVIPPNDIDSMVSVLLHLAKFPDLRKELGRKSLDLVLKNWSQQNVINEFQKELVEICRF